MIGIIIALYEEAYVLIHRFKLIHTALPHEYVGVIDGHSCSIFLCSVKVRNKKYLSKWYDQYTFSFIFNIGFVASLTKKLHLGTCLTVHQVYQKTDKWVCDPPPELLIGLYTSLLTVPEILQSSQQKKTQRNVYKNMVDSADMEAGYLCKKLYNQYGFSLSRFIIYKIVGDTLHDRKYLSKERYLRSFFSEQSFSKKIMMLRKAGWFAGMTIYLRKLYLQQCLQKQIRKAIKNTDKINFSKVKSRRL